MLYISDVLEIEITYQYHDLFLPWWEDCRNVTKQNLWKIKNRYEREKKKKFTCVRAYVCKGGRGVNIRSWLSFLFSSPFCQASVLRMSQCSLRKSLYPSSKARETQTNVCTQVCHTEWHRGRQAWVRREREKIKRERERERERERVRVRVRVRVREKCGMRRKEGREEGQRE